MLGGARCARRRGSEGSVSQVGKRRVEIGDIWTAGQQDKFSCSQVRRPRWRALAEGGHTERRQALKRMMKDNTKARLGLRRMRLDRLMAMGLHAGQPWTDRELRAVLEFHLDAPLRVESRPGSPPSASPTPVAARKEPRPDLPTIRTLLRHERPPLDLLERVKFFGKANAAASDGDVPREVGLVLYYAAIAVARLRRQKRISRLTDARLRQSLEWMLEQAWVPGDLKAVVRKATEALQHKGCGPRAE